MDIQALDIERGAKLVMHLSFSGEVRFDLQKGKCRRVASHFPPLGGRGFSFLIGLRHPKQNPADLRLSSTVSNRQDIQIHGHDHTGHLQRQLLCWRRNKPRPRNLIFHSRKCVQDIDRKPRVFSCPSAEGGVFRLSFERDPYVVQMTTGSRGVAKIVTQSPPHIAISDGYRWFGIPAPSNDADLAGFAGDHVACQFVSRDTRSGAPTSER